MGTPARSRPPASKALYKSLIQATSGNRPLDEVRLPTRVGLTRLAIDRRELPDQFVFELFVFTSRIGVIAKVIAESQCPPFFRTARLNDMNVMRVRPPRRRVEERTERIVWMRNVRVSRGSQAVAIGCQRLESRD